jgi:molybdenum cofactor guanylyltransferase
MTVAGVILAGGLSRRMGGGDKSLRLLAGRPILAHVVERAKPQVACLALNANGDPCRFAGFGLPVIADNVAGHAGPLAGLLAAFDWAEAPLVATFAADGPFLPLDLVARLRASLAPDVEVAVAASGGRLHPVYGLWRRNLREDLRRALGGGLRRLDRWVAGRRAAIVAFASEPVDPFFNINEPADLAAAEAMLA